MTAAAGNRRVLLGVLAVLGIVPVATGLLGIIRGPAGAPGGAATTASVDSEYRFVNVFWAAAGGVLWWTLRKPDTRVGVTRFVLLLAAAGGLPRLLSLHERGRPHPVFQGTIVLELVIIPLVLLWHRRVFSSSQLSAKKDR